VVNKSRGKDSAQAVMPLSDSLFVVMRAF
jgi:hypothetical protein